MIIESIVLITASIAASFLIVSILIHEPTPEPPPCPHELWMQVHAKVDGKFTSVDVYVCMKCGLPDTSESEHYGMSE